MTYKFKFEFEFEFLYHKSAAPHRGDKTILGRCHLRDGVLVLAIRQQHTESGNDSTVDVNALVYLDESTVDSWIAFIYFPQSYVLAHVRWSNVLMDDFIDFI